MTRDARGLPTRTLLGYADRWSAAPGDRLSFMVSSFGPERYRAELVRLSGDVAAPGHNERVIPNEANRDYPARRQEIHAGSYAEIADSAALQRLQSFTLALFAWPTTPARGRQALTAKWDEAKRAGFLLAIGADGTLTLELGDREGRTATVSSKAKLLAREWYWIAASYDAASGNVTLQQQPLSHYAKADDRASVAAKVQLGALAFDNGKPLTFAAAIEMASDRRPRAILRYNGKIEAPRLATRALHPEEIEQLRGPDLPARLRPDLIGFWDFSRAISSTRIEDLSDARHQGTARNLPTRAMKGHHWNGRERDWTQAPQHYGAIHFHENDLYDAGWQKDFELSLPKDLPSGIYAMRLTAGEEIERIPFFVRAAVAPDKPRALFLLPTCSYMAYINERQSFDGYLGEQGSGHAAGLGAEDLFLNQHREYGYSFYDTHEDGSGVSISSRLRPTLNVRPGHSTSWVGPAGTGPWQFAADLDILEWLETQGFAYDIATDEDLHREGLSLLSRYPVVLTGSHPEYHSTQMLDALQGYLQRGGRLMYLGANGFYWRIAFHPELSGVIELRRTEDGVRDWQAEPGEYVMSFTGEYGGLWRRIGRPPQMLAGVGFVAQGFDVSSHYRRRPGSFDPRAAFIFEGIGKDETIGDFGRVGGGAAGLELDAVDRLLGSPPHTLVLAASENHSNVYLMVPEEVTSTIPAVSGVDCPSVRAELAFFETPNGGAVFSTGSIAWAGALNHEDGKNNVSRLTGNVLRRFLEPTPF
ncbi:large subunit of N,N-dimethylformamidase [Hypericibacter adhaerens]|uniref:Large subunit of N,N-dimethylformamidase n=1 Tax=Hypericibacter adhaerens TaxID=2602016 RepID=A0A5J6N3Z9_9PROT|nr:N,N-dimethylformamidase beta subunit family domain-containing protein [Hypericibacter adhaerens]QEX24134.1 large subunit of N,N-dimethylformamidase [Hypericibacter adhaerens]